MMLLAGLLSVMFEAVRATGAAADGWLAVNEPICGPVASKRARANRPLPTGVVPATTIRPSGYRAKSTLSAMTLKPVERAMPPVPNEVSRLPSAALYRATMNGSVPLVRERSYESPATTIFPSG